MKRDPVTAAEAVETDPAEWLRKELASIPDPAETPSDLQRLRALATEVASRTAPTGPMLVALFALIQRLHPRGENAETLKIAQLSVELARELGEASHLRRALSTCGVALTQSGDLATAAATLVEALQVARKLRDPQCAAPVWHNLGLVFQRLGQYEAARRCAQRAIALLPRDKYFLDDHAWVSMALCDVQLENFKEAAEEAQRAIESCARVEGERALVGVAMARHFLIRARLALGQAEQACEEAPPPSCDGDVPTTLAAMFDQVTRAMLLTVGDPGNSGIARLVALVEFSKERFPAQHPEVVAALFQALEVTGRTDEALVYLHDMLAATRLRLSDRLREQLLAEAADLDNDGYASLLASKAAKLQVSVARRISELQKSAVIGSEQAGHDRLRIFRVSRLAELFATELGWEPDRAARLGFAATVMDAGLAVLPRGLAIKRRGLSVAERRMVHEHVTAGADLLAAARLSVLEPCIPIARFHHERCDGRGPLGLAGEAIPIEARIASLADAFDALTHDRPWRGAMTAAAALRTIAEAAGTQFDPNLAPRFVDCVKAMYWDHDKLDDYLAESAGKYDLPYLATRNELDQLIAAGGAA